jgi:hypothetical protein
VVPSSRLCHHHSRICSACIIASRRAPCNALVLAKPVSAVSHPIREIDGRVFMDKHFFLDFTPTGMIPTKRMTPHVPAQPAEIVSRSVCPQS